MIKNYMTYPLKNMRITQNYYGETSHRNHWDQVTDHKDYPIDDGGKDSGIEAIYCPCDEMIVTAIRGIGNTASNTIWLVSTSKVYTPTFYDTVFMTLTHSSDSDLGDILVGKRFKRGEIICYEGKDGATSNHVHIVCGRGRSDSWVTNSRGSLVMLGDSKRPEEVFYLDRTFTTEYWGGYLPWIDLPTEEIGTPVTRDTSIDQLEVLIENLHARNEASINGEILGYVKPGIYDIKEIKETDDYSWYKIEDFYIAYQDTWIRLLPNEAVSNDSDILEQPKLIFQCKKTGKYIISLKEGDQLYLL